MGIRYEYKNIPIKGGGFVTGFVFSKKTPGILYARTDIGGVYRFNFKKSEWVSLIDNVKATDPLRCYPLGVAVDDADQRKLYIACGDHRTGRLCISSDMGETYTEKPIPCGIHGNHMGRSTGERLIKKDGVLYFASQTEGLFASADDGETWQNTKPFGEKNLTFVYKENLCGCDFFLIGATGEANARGNKRGHTLFVSYDGLGSCEKIYIPKAPENPVCEHPGFVPQRAACDGKYLYVTFVQTESGFGGFDAISADSSKVYDGRLIRYKMQDEKLVFDKDITPKCIPFRNTHGSVAEEYLSEIILGAGLSGVCCEDGMLVVSEVGSKRFDDAIYLSTDHGESFSVILKGLDTGKIDFTVSYMKPKYNGNRSLIHWMSDIKIDPFDSDKMIFNTGTGAFMTTNLRDGAKGGTVRFFPVCDGMEETVHLNVYSPPSGDVRCIDIIGDLGGFVFGDLDKEPENSFANDRGDRYITCLNADFSDKNPRFFAATPRGNWTGLTKGGIIVTHDQGISFKLLKYPIGISETIDELVEQIQKPNVDSGWVAVTADSKRIVWAISGMRRGFFTDSVVYTDDEGESWKQSCFIGSCDYDKEPVPIKIYSCREDENFLWALNDKGTVFVSQDKGATFNETAISGDSFFEPNDGHHTNNFEARAEPGKRRVLWAAFLNSGLIKLEYKDGIVSSLRLTAPEDKVRGIGFGKPKPECDHQTVFTAGVIGGEYGFWRSTDHAKSFERINTDRQCFGTIISISGDPREFGRVYIATGSKGLITGSEIKE